MQVRVKAKLATLWKAAQVELQGAYSTDRVQKLLNYSTHVSNVRVLLVLLIAPLPCLLVTTAVDTVRLHPIDSRINGNYRFFGRAIVAFWIVGIVTYFQFRHGVPALPLSNWKIIACSAIVAMPTVGVMYGLSIVVGFPLPFSLITVSPAWLTFMMVPIAPWLRKAYADAVMWPHVMNMTKVLASLEVFVVVYPAYFYVFTTLPESGKTAFAMLLPVMKLIFRRVMSRTAVHLEDEILLFIIMNVDVSSALFVAYCMQNSPSMLTTFGLMAFDAIQIYASLYDMGRIIRRLKILRKQINGNSTAAKDRKRAKSDFYLAQDIFKHQSWHDAVSLGLVSSLPLKLSRKMQLQKPVSIVPQPNVIANGNCGPTLRDAAEAIVAAPEFQYMQELCTLLYITEFVVLLNYVEVIVPAIFSAYLLAMYHLPNRAYYEQIATMDEARLHATLLNVLLYAVLQLVSLVVLNVVLWRRMRFSVLRQLSFVLETEWGELQAKLLFWVFYNTQASLQHFGSDYTFQFAWLRVPPDSSR